MSIASAARRATSSNSDRWSRADRRVEAERHHAERAPARAQRHEQRALGRELRDQLAVGLVLGRDVGAVGVLDEPRAPGGEDLEQRVRAAVGERVALHELAQVALVGRVARDGRHAADGADGAAEEDHAGVGELADGEAGERVERRVLVEHRIEGRARLGQERGAVQEPLALGLGARTRRDVAGDDDDLAPVADLERHAGDLHRDAVAVAVADRDPAAGLGLSLEPRPRVPASGRALLLDDEVEDRRQRPQLLGRVAADRLEGRVRVLEAALGVEHDHRLADVGEGEQQRLVARRLLAHRALGGAPLRDLEHDRADADDAAVAAPPHGPVGDEPLAVDARRRGGRAADLELGQRLAARRARGGGRPRRSRPRG